MMTSKQLGLLLGMCAVIAACSSSSNNQTTIPNEETGTETTSGTIPEPEPEPATPSTETIAPNILLIISDDQGIDASSQYSVSADMPDTPTLDSLAESGLVFENAWATPQCTTTRGSIITGKHGINSGIDRVPDFMPTDTMTLQRYLGSDDNTGTVDTAVIGKWHLTGADRTLVTHPVDSGVGYYAGNIAGTIDDYSSWPLTENGATSTSTGYHTSVVTDLAIDWIAQRNNPWFLWLAYVSPHSPFHLPPAQLHNRALSGSEADIAANPREYYLAAIEAMDSEINRLLSSLSQQEIENTLIVYIGDNGTPARVIDTAVYARNHSKSSLYEGGVRVPMIVAGAGVTRQNERETALVNSVDIFATVLDSFALPLPTDIDGVSFLDTLDNSGVTTRSHNYSEFVTDNAEQSDWTVRDDRYKYIANSDGSAELYDLFADADEQVNLIDSPEINENVIRELAAFGESVRQGR